MRPPWEHGLEHMPGPKYGPGRGAKNVRRAGCLPTYPACYFQGGRKSTAPGFFHPLDALMPGDFQPLWSGAGLGLQSYKEPGKRGTGARLDIMLET